MIDRIDVTPIKLDELIPSAYSFQVATCGDPECGIHLISIDRDGAPLIQTVMSLQQMRDVIDTFEYILAERRKQ